MSNSTQLIFLKLKLQLALTRDITWIYVSIFYAAQHSFIGFVQVMSLFDISKLSEDKSWPLTDRINNYVTKSNICFVAADGSRCYSQVLTSPHTDNLISAHVLLNNDWQRHNKGLLKGNIEAFSSNYIKEAYAATWSAEKNVPDFTQTKSCKHTQQSWLDDPDAQHIQQWAGNNY